MKLNKEITEFMDSITAKDKFTAIDYVSPLIKKYGMSRELAEKIRHVYVCELFKKIGKKITYEY